MPSDQEILQVVHGICQQLDGDVSMATIARRAGWSSAHLHRDFRRVVTETPKQFTLRIRLERAAVRLAESTDRIVDVALDSGFASHEVFSRAFRRHFGRSAREHRARPRADSTGNGTTISTSVGPCITLFHVRTQAPARGKKTPKTMSETTITTKTVAAQPAVFIRRRTSRADIAKALGECLPATYGFCQNNDIAMAGPPFTRYPETGMGMLTIECGIPTANKVVGEGEIQSGELHAGKVATTVHVGSYDTLQDTYAKLELWMEDNGHKPAGAPWETYLTDPGEVPNPEEWQTEICWPLA